MTDTPKKTALTTCPFCHATWNRRVRVSREPSGLAGLTGDKLRDIAAKHHLASGLTAKFDLGAFDWSAIATALASSSAGVEEQQSHDPGQWQHGLQEFDALVDRTIKREGERK